MFTVGDKVGSYEIIARLKSGGMATLFLGRRAGAAGFAKFVAIKVVHEHLAARDDFVQMFVDEARLGARIQHPNVVHVEELQEKDGRLYLVMEYVYGCSLGQFFYALARRKRRLTGELAAHIALKVADGLHAAHELRDSRGESLAVVHRDVSPQNILLAFQGNVKLIDFGVAKARGRMRETEKASIKGKFRYMSPEQAKGGDLDRRTDIYALGVVLWEMLAMRRRFDGNTDSDLLRQVRNPDCVPPSHFHHGLPEELDEVVLKATAPNPDDRYQTAHEMREALVVAVPRAAALHESVLGELLAVVMSDQIERRKSELPSGVSGMTVDVPSGESVVAEQALHTLTIATADIELLADGKSDPTGPPEPPTMVLDQGTQVNPEQAIAPAESMPPSGPPKAPRSDGVPLPAVVTAVALMLLALGGLSVLLVYLVTDEPPPTATELPTTAPAATEPSVPDAGLPAVAFPQVATPPSTQDPSGSGSSADTQEGPTNDTETDPSTSAAGDGNSSESGGSGRTSRRRRSADDEDDGQRRRRRRRRPIADQW